MNVRIFWVHAMKCMCAQTRPRFILSSEGVFGGMEFEPMLTPREKSPLPKMSPEEDRTRDAVDSEPKHFQLSYSGPRQHIIKECYCIPYGTWTEEVDVWFTWTGECVCLSVRSTLSGRNFGTEHCTLNQHLLLCHGTLLFYAIFKTLTKADSYKV